MRNDGGPAFPVNWQEWHDQRIACMTLRDYFAAKALSGMLGNDYWAQNADETMPSAIAATASCAYAVADAMLKARESGDA